MRRRSRETSLNRSLTDSDRGRTLQDEHRRLKFEIITTRQRAPVTMATTISNTNREGGAMTSRHTPPLKEEEKEERSFPKSSQSRGTADLHFEEVPLARKRKPNTELTHGANL
ncbi:hypothetical protein INR49_030933 [Caranx melampygus]|nr:hypothetical protein INR49_030933 [Caranx melampygus]